MQEHPHFDDSLSSLRHTASHIMAQAVKKLRPEAKLAIGPGRLKTAFTTRFPTMSTSPLPRNISPPLERK